MDDETFSKIVNKGYADERISASLDRNLPRISHTILRNIAEASYALGYEEGFKEGVKYKESNEFVRGYKEGSENVLKELDKQSK